MSLTIYNPHENFNEGSYGDSNTVRKRIPRAVGDNDSMCLKSIRNFHQPSLNQVKALDEMPRPVPVEYPTGTSQRCRLCDIPIGSMVYNIESPQMYGEPLCPFGSPAKILGANNGFVILRMRSDEIYYLDGSLQATFFIQVPETTPVLETPPAPFHVPQPLSHPNIRHYVPITSSVRPVIESKITFYKIMKITAIFAVAVIGFAFLDDILSGRIGFSSETSSENSNSIIPCNPIVNATGYELIGNCNENDIRWAKQEHSRLKNMGPCKIQVEPYYLDIEGDCTLEEKTKAHEEQKRLFDERQLQLKEEGKRAAQESWKEFDAHIEQIEKDWAEREAKRKETERRMNNPTPEEKEEKLKEFLYDTMRRNPFMESYIRWAYSQYFDAPKAEKTQCPNDVKKIENPDYYLNMSHMERASNDDLTPECHDHALITLGVHPSTNSACSDLKDRFKEIIFSVHPDRNPLEKNADKASKHVNAAFNTLCN